MDKGAWQETVFLPGEFHGQRSLAGNSILAWRIPWTKEPGRLHGVAQLDTTEQLTLCYYYIPAAAGKEIPGTVANQAPLPMEFFRQGYWSG